jgi:Mn-dependent DtxR family transcriptional regulator
MKTKVKKTSIKAYNSLRLTDLLCRTQQIVLKAMRKNAKYTRKEIAHRINFETSTVAGRVNELIAKGYIDVVGKKICPISKKTVEAIIKVY